MTLEVFSAVLHKAKYFAGIKYCSKISFGTLMKVALFFCWR